MTDKLHYTEEEERRYIGDGVYAHFDGYQIWLTTLEGMRIALEPEVYAALVTYHGDLEKMLIERHRQKLGE